MHRLSMPPLTLVALSMLLATPLCATGAAPPTTTTTTRTAPGRERSTMDFGWKFATGDPADAQKPAFDDGQWKPVDLPHDWSIEGPFDREAPATGGGAYLPTGIGWYRKTFKLPESHRGRRIKIEFDGIYERSEVWINGRSLGTRPFGYASFVYDLTPHLNFDGRDNVLAVRVDNSAQPNSRWYSGSGIYRHTWLLVSDDLHVPQWGSFVTTPEVTADAATIDVSMKVVNQRRDAAKFELHYAVLDPQGKAVRTAQGSGELAAGAENRFSQKIEISKPALWSLESPNLYTLRCQLRSGDTLIDQYDTPFGIRTAEFDANKGFLLNGQRVKMNGVCLHFDGGGVGAAVPEGIWVRRLKLLKEMGCNAIRTSHNPPAPEFLDLCDRMGFLVMDEVFDEWEVGKRPQTYHRHFQEWWREDLLAFLHRDRNHPSVVLWSAGNEVGDQTSPNGVAVLKKLLDVFHTEDPTRLVTVGCDRIAAEPTPTPVEFLSLLDVVGYNYVDRWRDRTNTYYHEDRQAHPTWKVIGTESTSMAGVRGDYEWLLPRRAATQSTPTQTGATQPATRPVGRLLGSRRLDVEQLWKFVRNHDYVAGDFMWTGIDYLGEARWPNKIATFGAIDTCGFKKDGFHFYQSQWTDTPVLHVMPHWNLAGREGQVIPVTCYTNCETVELFLNGRSLGVKGYEFPRKGMQEQYGTYPPRASVPRTTSDLHLSWDVPYEPGTLRAVGTKDGKPVVTEIATTGAPAAIELSVDKPQVTADRRDVAHVEVRVVDEKGRIVPTASDDITFEVTGPAKLISVDNGNPASDESFKGTRRKVFHGMALAILQSTHDAGDVRVTAKATGLREATVTIKSQPPAGN